MSQDPTPRQLAHQAYKLFNRIAERRNGHAAHGEKEQYERVSTLAEKAFRRYERRYYSIPPAERS